MATHKRNIAPQLEYIGSHFKSFQKNGQGWKALCPLHDDTKPSLSINEGDRGILVHCHAGCPTDDVLAVVGLRTADLRAGAKRIVAEYDYLDELSVLLYQSVKYEPKDFRQRRPKVGGGWDWSTKGVRRVLYRLPELLKSDPKRPVFICEGEKDCDRLASLGLTATTNVGGAGNWCDEYNEFLSGRHAVILPDNDAKGWDHVKLVARNLEGIAASIKIVELPNLPDRGDVSDWLDQGGRKPSLLGIVNRAGLYLPNAHRPIGSKPEGQGEGSNPSGSKKHLESQDETRGVNPMGNADPVPGGPMCTVTPFPVVALPALLRPYTESIAVALPCPPDYAAAMMLAVASILIGRKRCIQVKPGWVEYAVLWIVLVARSGERKTPVFNAVTAPLRAKQKQLLAEYLKAKSEWDNLPADQKQAEPEPKLQQLVTTDATIEALKDVLASNPNGIGLTVDELTGWVRSMCQYKGGRGDDRQHWLSIWSCVLIICNRKGAKPIIINNPFVSIVGGVQPDVLGDLIDDAREDGFSARLLFSYPAPIGQWCSCLPLRVKRIPQRVYCVSSESAI